MWVRSDFSSMRIAMSRSIRETNIDWTEIIEDLWRSGYIVTTKVGTIAGGTYKCNFDVEITMDILKVVYQVKPDIIVLATGDSDFVSLIQEVRKSGIRVEVAAFEETAGADIMSKCSGFIDLAVYYDGYLAVSKW